MVVMLGTAIATVTMTDTRRALYTAGAHRVDIQGRYAAEGALLSTLGWFDWLSDIPGRFDTVVVSQWKAARALPGNGSLAPPMLPLSPEPQIPLWQNNNANLEASWVHDAMRVPSGQVVASMNPGTEVPPLTNPGDTIGGPIDAHGTFGPNNALGPAPNFEVDLFDCVRGQAQVAAGGSDPNPPVPLRCQVTARQRSIVRTPADFAPITCNWTVPLQGRLNAQVSAFTGDEFRSLHTASAIVETPPVNPF